MGLNTISLGTAELRLVTTTTRQAIPELGREVADNGFRDVESFSVDQGAHTVWIKEHSGYPIKCAMLVADVPEEVLGYGWTTGAGSIWAKRRQLILSARAPGKG